MRVLDITDPANAKVVYSKGGVWGPEGSSEDWDAKTVQDYFGGMTIPWSDKPQRHGAVTPPGLGRLAKNIQHPGEAGRLRLNAGRLGVKAGNEEPFRAVHVADATQHRLVEQQRAQ